jgi:hypothetical protein
MGQSVALFGQSSCIACPAGSYNFASGQSMCIDCPSGSFTTYYGSTTLSNCSTCPSGFFSLAGASACTLCAAGTFCLPGSGAPIPCPPNTFSNVNGTSNCQSCPGSLFPVDTGLTSCSIAIVHAQLAADGNTVAVTFGNSTIPVSGNVDCLLIFPASNLSLFGSVQQEGDLPPSCTVFDDVLYVSVGDNPTMRSGQLVFMYNSIYSAFSDKTATTSSDTTMFAIAPPSPLPPVSTVLSSPSTVGYCNGIIVDSSASTGAMRQSFYKFWSFVSSTPALTANQTSAIQAVIQSANAAGLAGTLTPGLRTLSLPSSVLPAGVAYTFSLKLTNWLGMSNVGTIIVVKSSAPLLPIKLSGNEYTKILRSESFLQSASTITELSGSCFNASMIANLTFSFSWKQLFTLPASVNRIGGISLLGASIAQDQLSLPSLQVVSPNLVIPPSTLLVNQTYVFAVTLKTSLIYLPSTLQAFHTIGYIAVFASASPLVARIKGGDRQVWVDATAPPVVFDGSGSYDPDAGNTNAGLKYSWSCLRMSGISCFDPTTAASIAIQKLIPLLSLASMSFADSATDPYTVSLSISKSGRTDDAFATVSAIFVPLPAISIQVLVPTQGANYIVINSNDKVQLSAVIQSVSSAQAVSYLLQWSCPVGGFDLAAPGSLASSPSSPALVINPNQLIPGESYVFSLTLTSTSDASKRTQSNASFTIHSPPVGGRCTVSPLTGVTLQTRFSFTCFNWDGNVVSNPISFSFQVYDEGARRSVSILRSPSPSGLFETYLPVGDPLVVLVVVTDRFGGLTNVFVRLKVNQAVVSNPQAVAAIATSALSGLAYAQQAGDINSASQFVGPLISVLSAAGAEVLKHAPLYLCMSIVMYVLYVCMNVCMHA